MTWHGRLEQLQTGPLHAAGKHMGEGVGCDT